MSKINYRHKQDRARATKYREQVVALNRELVALRKRLPVEYARGSAETFGLVYAALGNELILLDWLTARLRNVDKKLAIPPEVEDLIVEELLVEKARRRGKAFEPSADLKWTPPTKLFDA